MFRELRYSLRQLSRSPGFALGVILNLALGIGASSAAFAVLRSVLLQPLPYPEPDRLVAIFEQRTDGLPSGVRAANYADWRERQRVFSSLGIYDDYYSATLTGTGEPRRLAAHRVSAGYFEALAVEPRLGRGVSTGDDQPGADPVVVLSHRFWSRHLGAEPAALGRRLSLSGKQHTVVGIMGPDFRSPRRDVELWVPLALTAEEWSDRDSFLFRAVGRLAPDVPLARARRELERISRQLVAEHPAKNRDWGAACRLLLDNRVGHLRPALYLLLAAAGLVLAVACVNVSHLVLARGAARQQEIGLRVALGASRAHLLRQALAESGVLALSGGASGVALAYAVTRAVVAWNPGSIPRLDEIRLDAGTIGWSIAVTAASAMLFALVPVLRAGGAKLPLVPLRGNLLRTSAKGSKATAGTGRRYLHQLLVALESAMVLMLLMAAFQMLRSLDRLMEVDLGFDTAGRIAFEITLPESKYARWLDNARVVERLSERLESLPGVQAAGAAMSTPLVEAWFTESAYVEGEPPPGEGHDPAIGYKVVTASYLTALGVSLLGGRHFTPSDDSESNPVVLINQAMARRFDREPLGRRIRLSEKWYTVIGIVGDFRTEGLEAPPWPDVYLANLQLYDSWTTRRFVVWLQGDPFAHLAAIRQAVWSVDPDLPISDVQALATVVSGAAAEPRFRARLLTLFATVALVLGALGIYGVIAYTTAQRRREMAIRLALGGRPRDILGLVLAAGLRPVIAGAVVGVAGTIALARVVEGLLYEVSPTDPAALLLIALFLTAVAALGTLMPALSAARLNPAETLRCDG